MFWVIYWLTPQAGYTAVAFLIGAVVSIISGTIGMIIATQANFRTTFCAKKSLA
jgi:Na+/H+-translocating membrane pyrophosphatase